MNTKIKYNNKLTSDEIDKLVEKHFNKYYPDYKSFENNLSEILNQSKKEIEQGNFISFEDFCKNFKNFCDEMGVEYPLNDRIWYYFISII